MSRSFGWDLAAYGRDSYSALCEGSRVNNCFTATLLRCDAICRPKLTMTADLRAVVAGERRVREACTVQASSLMSPSIFSRSWT